MINDRISILQLEQLKLITVNLPAIETKRKSDGYITELSALRQTIIKNHDSHGHLVIWGDSNAAIWPRNNNKNDELFDIFINELDIEPNERINLLPIDTMNCQIVPNTFKSMNAGISKIVIPENQNWCHLGQVEIILSQHEIKLLRHHLMLHGHKEKKYNNLIQKVWDPMSTTDHRWLAITLRTDTVTSNKPAEPEIRQPKPNWYNKEFKKVYTQTVTEKLIDFNIRERLMKCHETTDIGVKQKKIDKVYIDFHDGLLESTELAQERFNANKPKINDKLKELYA